MMNQENKKPVENMGDGLYAEFDGYGLSIRLGSHDSREAAYIEPSVLKRLNDFYKQCTEGKNHE